MRLSNLVALTLVLSVNQAQANLILDLAERFHIVDEQEKIEAKSTWDKYLEQQKIKLNVRVNRAIELGDNFDLNTGIGYNYRVEPSFIDQYHQRYDVYRFTPSLSLSHDHVGASLGAGAIMSFSRPFDNKMKAIKALPPIYKLWERNEWKTKFPWNANLARDSKVLAPREAARLEFNSDSSVGLGDETMKDHFKLGIGAYLSTGNRVIIDIYKLETSTQSNKVRMRLVTSRARANLGMEVTAVFDKAFDIGVSLLNKAANKWFKCKPFNLKGEMTALESTPLETFMVDYILDLTPNADGSPSEGAKAYDSIMAYINSAFKLANLRHELNFLRSEEKLAASLEEKVIVAERAFKAGDKTVNRMFKGHTSSRYGMNALGTNCFKLWDLEGAQTNYDTYVRSFDLDSSSQQEKQSEFIYISALTDKRKEVLEFLPDFGVKIFGEKIQLSGVSKRYTFRMNAVFDAKSRDENSRVLAPISEGLSDMIIERDLTDASMSAGEVKTIKELISYDLAPVFAQQPISMFWDKFTGDRTNAYAKVVFEIHGEALNELKSLKNISQMELEAALRVFIDKYPAKAWLTSSLQNDFEYQIINEQNPGSIEADIIYISKYLSRALGAQTPDERIAAFQSLRRNSVFQEVGPGFIIRMLAGAQTQLPLQDLITVRLRLGSTEGNSIPYMFGTRSESTANYRAVDYMLGLINDRSFDLRVQMNGVTGQFQPISQEQ